MKPNNQNNLSSINNWLSDLNERIGDKSVGNIDIRLTELYGSEIIEPTSFEPDPNTYRNAYYFNSVTNALYKKLEVSDGKFRWAIISD